MLRHCVVNSLRNCAEPSHPPQIIRSGLNHQVGDPFGPIA
jgi:hypothetical protein